LIGQVFTVLTEFKFEVGAAVLQTDMLTGAVNNLSQSADNAVTSLQYAAASIVASFVGGTGGGILGVFYSAIMAADKFKSSQISLANTLTQPGETFASAMERAGEAMESIGSVAKTFSLPADSLLQMTKLLGPMLQVHNLAGQNYSKAIGLGRRFLKAAPMLGVDPSLAMGQMQGIVGGHTGMHSTLFQRLTGETKTMAPFMGNSKSFNQLDTAKRVQLLNRALDEFANNTKAVEAQAHTLNGEMVRLRTNMSGAFSIMREIGEKMIRPVLQVLSGLNQYIEMHGKKISKNLAHMIDPWTSDIRTMVTTLTQIRDLKKDLSNTASLLSATAIVLGLHEVMLLFGISIPFISAALAKLAGFIHFILPTFATLTAEFGALAGTLTFFTNFLGLVALLVFYFQLFSRAWQHAKIDAMIEVANRMAEITEVFSNTSGIIGILVNAFDVLSRWLSVLLRPDKFLGFINLISLGIGIVDGFNAVLGGFLILFSGFALAFMEMFNQLFKWVLGQGFDKSKIGEAWSFGQQEIADKIFGKVKEPGAEGVGKSVVNMDVKMENHFKEMMEPDRVAFTIKDQLLKASQNRTSGARAKFKPVGAF